MNAQKNIPDVSCTAAKLPARLAPARFPRPAREHLERSAWSDFGPTAADFARERLGRRGRWLRDPAVLAHALEELPALEAALSGRDSGLPIGKVAALAIARAASAESIDAWIGLARAVSVRGPRGIVNASRSVGSAWPRHIGDARQEQDESPRAASTC